MNVSSSICKGRDERTTVRLSVLCSTVQISALLFLSCMTGCAAIPNEVDLLVQTSPPGATVESSDGWTCTTPCTHQVARNSQFDLAAERSGYITASKRVEVPAFERSNRYRNLGRGVGFLVMLAGAEVAGDLGSALIEALTGDEISVLSTGEKIGSGLIGGGVFGRIGYAIDRLRDQERSARPIPVEIELEEAAVTSN